MFYDQHQTLGPAKKYRWAVGWIALTEIGYTKLILRCHQAWLDGNPPWVVRGFPNVNTPLLIAMKTRFFPTIFPWFFHYCTNLRFSFAAEMSHLFPIFSQRSKGTGSWEWGKRNSWGPSGPHPDSLAFTNHLEVSKNGGTPSHHGLTYTKSWSSMTWMIWGSPF